MAERAEMVSDVEGLAALARSVDEGQEGLLRRGLDWLSRLVRYDLAAVFELQQGSLRLRMARGPLADNRVRQLHLKLEDFPTIRSALETRRARAYTETDHAHGDGDPFDGVLDLPPGHSCMVVPLAAGERVFGVLTLDRQECEIYPPALVELVEVYGQVLGLALLSAEQRARLEVLHRQNAGYVRLLETQVAGQLPAGLLESEVPRVKALVARSRQVATTDAHLLLTGAPDSGQVQLALAMHGWSERAARPFVMLDCRDGDPGRLREALFGGTDAQGRPTVGHLFLAEGGTLFLDGVEHLPAPLQAALSVLRRDDAGEGGSGDVRLMASTYGGLEEAVARGRFDESLYFRLSAVQLALPPLVERQADLPALVEGMLTPHGVRTGRLSLRVSAAAMHRLRAHPWPGNLRELANVLERAAMGTRAEVLLPGHLTLDAGKDGDEAARPTPMPAPEREGRLLSMEEMERQHIARVLGHCEGRIYGEGGAAEVLGLKPTTLQSRMKKLGLTRLGR